MQLASNKRYLLALLTGTAIAAVATPALGQTANTGSECVLDSDEDGVGDTTGNADGDDGEDALACGFDAQATGPSTTAVGGESVATGPGATAYGWQAWPPQNARPHLVTWPKLPGYARLLSVKMRPPTTWAISPSVTAPTPPAQAR